jgi:hypothetical protein
VAPLGTLATTVPNGDRRGVSDAGAQRSRPAKPPRATSTTERAERRTTRWNGRRTSQWIAYHRAKRAAGTAGLDAGKWAAGGEDIGRLERLFRCGRHAVRLPEGQGGCVRLTAGPSTASYTGLASCASVWACPVCAERINAERATVNERAIDAAAAQGLQMAFVTLTMRHHAGQALGELWDALADALHAATVSDRAVQRGRELLGVRGLRRVVEPTHGPNGWHIHAHLIVFYDGLPEDPRERRERLLDLAELLTTDRKRVTRETERERMADEFDAGGDPDRLALDALAEPIWRGWRRRLVARGLEPPMREPGLVVSPVRVTGAHHELARYVSKVSYDAAARGSARRTGIGVELADPGAKRGRGMHRTPFEILADLAHRKRAGVLSRRATAAQARDRAIWNEFVDACHGRRQMAWSPGLRQLLLGDDAELTDEEIAAHERDDGPDRDDVALLLPDTWRVLVRAAAETDLLSLVERHGLGRGCDPFALVERFCADLGAYPPLRPEVATLRLPERPAEPTGEARGPGPPTARPAPSAAVPPALPGLDAAVSWAALPSRPSKAGFVSTACLSRVTTAEGRGSDATEQQVVAPANTREARNEGR